MKTEFADALVSENRNVNMPEEMDWFGALMGANGCDPADPMINICHISPHEAKNPDEFAAEICYPVKKKIRGDFCPGL